MLRALLELSRVSNLPTVWTNVLAAWIIASGADWRWTPALGWLLLGASLIYSAGMILNDACDAVWDREHRKERPIPSGRIGLKTVWIIGIGGLVSGYALMVFAGGASWKITGLLVAAVVAYDVYHKPWAGSVILMGACRTLLYLAAGSASLLDSCKSEVDWWILGISGTLLGLYIIALSLAARAERKGLVGWVLRYAALVFWVLPVFWALIIWVPSSKGPNAIEPLLWPPVLSYLIWLYFSARKLRKGGKEIGEAVGCLLAGIPLLDALLISWSGSPIIWVLCALPPFLRLWQRWIVAT